MSAQHNAVDTLTSRFNSYREKALTEKIYAHLDGSFYLTGETMWFKIYSVDGSFHKPVDVSKVAYAEVLDSENVSVLKAKIELRNGLGSGSFFLPASLNTGNYKFRVYTSWMKNFPPDYYFHQVISVVNPFLVPNISGPALAATCRVDFFPEGGNLVSGIESKVAFKVSDASGKSAACRGLVQDENGDTLASFTPGKSGLGYFAITPSHERQYHAVITDVRGVQRKHALPKVQPAGYVIHLRDSGEQLTVSVRSLRITRSDIYLFIHARQTVASAQHQTLQGNRARFTFNKKDIPEGISHFTLFDADLQPVCERLYFKYPDKMLDIDLKTNLQSYSTRRKVSVSIRTKAHAEPVPAKLSLSVYREDSLGADKTMHIFPYLWLGSDLSGRIESPDYYLENVTPEVVEAMDNLMLTHGWRRFDWKHILEKTFAFNHLPEAKEHIVTAVITSDGEKKAGVFTYLGSPGKIIRAYGAWSDENGEARFEIKDFYGQRRIILQTNTDSSESYEIAVQDPFSQQVEAGKVPPFAPATLSNNELLPRSVAMQVQDIFYYDQQANRIIAPVVDSSAFYGTADATYLLDDYTRFPVMEEVMREYVPGVFVRKRKDGFHFLVVDHVNRGILQGDPMVLLDGVPVTDVDQIMRVDPRRVRKLEVVNRAYFLGQSVFSGIVSYTTYNGDLGGLELNPRSITIDYDGLQLRRRFHKPEYSGKAINDRMPDQRYLLHWEPDITTDQEGNYALEFYTSDVPGTYRVVVEGLSDKGFSGSAGYTFTVNSPATP